MGEAYIYKTCLFKILYNFNGCIETTMSHQTGILPDDKLVELFGKAKNGDIRLLKLVITSTSVTANKTENVQSNWEEDFDKMVKSCIEVPLAIFCCVWIR